MSKGRFTFEIAMSTMFARLTGRIALLLFGFAVSGFSASFDCVKAQSQTEKLICQSAALSRVDEEMAAAYKNALGLASRFAPDDARNIRIDQIAWLKGSVQGCTDRECLASAYKERTDALVFYAAHVSDESPGSFAYTGMYEVEQGMNQTGTLEIFQLRSSAIRFRLHITRILNAARGTVRGADMTGEATLKSGVVTYADPDDTKCHIMMTFQKTKAVVSQGGSSCGALIDVVADGTYKKTRSYVGSDLSK